MRANFSVMGTKLMMKHLLTSMVGYFTNFCCNIRGPVECSQAGFHLKFPTHDQSRTQSPQALWPAVSRQERLWGTTILLPRDFCGKTMETVVQSQPQLSHG